MLNQGSLLIELLIYLALVAVLGVMGFTWFSRSQRQLLATAQSSSSLMQLYSATDLLVRDLRASPRDPKAWLARGENSIIWRGTTSDIGWYQEKSSLYRVEGSYNLHQKKWNKKNKSIAIQNLESIRFEISQPYTQIKKVEVMVVVQSGTTRHSVQETVYPREGQT